MRFEFNNITLLSIEEYDENSVIIPDIGEYWWLRSPGRSWHDAVVVHHGVWCGPNHVIDKYCCVRPALILKPFDHETGERFVIAGHTWLVLSDTIAICCDSIGRTCFRSDWRAPDANDYEKSDIRKWLYNWAEKKGIMFTPV